MKINSVMKTLRQTVNRQKRTWWQDGRRLCLTQAARRIIAPMTASVYSEVHFKLREYLGRRGRAA